MSSQAISQDKTIQNKTLTHTNTNRYLYIHIKLTVPAGFFYFTSVWKGVSEDTRFDQKGALTYHIHLYHLTIHYIPNAFITLILSSGRTLNLLFKI